jgi:hypothetical protein
VRRKLTLAVAAAALTATASLALAVAAGPLALAANDDDARIAEQLVVRLEADPETRALTADAVRRSRDALERAARMRAAGDDAHARIAESLARDWAELGQDLVLAASTERRAEQTRAAALDAGATADRERALLEEGIARLGRLRAQLADVDRETDGGVTRLEALAGGEAGAVRAPAATTPGRPDAGPSRPARGAAEGNADGGGAP